MTRIFSNCEPATSSKVTCPANAFFFDATEASTLGCLFLDGAFAKKGRDTGSEPQDTKTNSKQFAAKINLMNPSFIILKDFARSKMPLCHKPAIDSFSSCGLLIHK